MERRREQRKEGRKERMRDSMWVGGGEGKGAGNMVISGPTDHELMSGMLPATPPPPTLADSALHLHLRCLKNARSRFKSFFFFAKNFDHLTISNKCRTLVDVLV